jgi:hypothetical protein
MPDDIADTEITTGVLAYKRSLFFTIGRFQALSGIMTLRITGSIEAKIVSEFVAGFVQLTERTEDKINMR